MDGTTNWTDPDAVTSPLNWDTQSTATDVSTNGYFTFAPEFITGATAMSIEFDPGSHYDGTSTWDNDALTTTQFSKASTTT